MCTICRYFLFVNNQRMVVILHGQVGVLVPVHAVPVHKHKQGLIAFALVQLIIYLLDHVLIRCQVMVAIIVLVLRLILHLVILHNHVQSMVIGQIGQVIQLVVVHVEVV